MTVPLVNTTLNILKTKHQCSALWSSTAKNLTLFMELGNSIQNYFNIVHSVQLEYVIYLQNQIDSDTNCTVVYTACADVEFVNKTVIKTSGYISTT